MTTQHERAMHTVCCVTYSSSIRVAATWLRVEPSAPAYSSSRTTRMCPLAAARCSAVLPACDSSGCVLHDSLTHAMQPYCTSSCTTGCLSAAAKLWPQQNSLSGCRRDDGDGAVPVMLRDADVERTTTAKWCAVDQVM
jgi:hypothetical protein